MHVFVVEDDDAIAEPLQEGLEREGWSVTRVATGGAAIEAACADAAPRHDVVLLDLRLPDIDGLDVCRRIRACSSVPIIVVSARGEESDRVVGLELGADDYVVKPYGMRELVARIRAVTRRSGEGERRGAADEQAVPAAGDASMLEWDTVRIEPAAHRAWVDGQPVDLTVIEFGIVRELVVAQGATVSRPQLLENVWGTRWYGPSKTIDVHVANLRRKLGDASLVETVRGVGYRLRGAP